MGSSSRDVEHVYSRVESEGGRGSQRVDRSGLGSFHRAIGNFAAGQMLQPGDAGVRLSDPSGQQEREAGWVADAALRSEAPLRGAGDRPAARPSVPAPVPGAGEPVPQRERFETELGRGLNDVRLHRGRDAAQLADALDARALSVGAHVVLGAQYDDPNTEAGRRVLMHELAHQALGHGQSGEVMRDVKPNVLANPMTDGRKKRVQSMLKDTKLEVTEAQDLVNLAKDDGKLAQGEKDPGKVEPAIINLLVRSGVPLQEARRLAGRTIEIAKQGTGSETVSMAPPTKLTEEEKTALRTSAEKDTLNNASAKREWTIEEIKARRADFLRNAVQMDGDVSTTTDYKACSSTSLVGGILLSRPQSIQDLAQKLESDAGKKEFPKLQAEPIKSAISRMAAGKFSAKDMSIVANGLYASTRYVKNDGTTSEGVSMPGQMALIARLRKLGFTPPAMRLDTYGTLTRDGAHVTAFANNTGYDPWAYPGNRGQAVLTDGDVAAANQSLAMGPRLGMQNQQRVMLERMKFDGTGTITFERHTVAGKALASPLKATYTLNLGENRWERDPKVVVSPDQEKELPQYIPIGAFDRMSMHLEKL